MDIAHQLAEYSNNLRYVDISEKVIHEAKRKIIDALGCAIAASNAEPVKVLKKIAKNVKGNSTILGTKIKTSAELATFTNGAMVRYLDFMDTYFYDGEYVHPEDNLSAILTAAESSKSSGKDLLLVTVLSYEISCRLVDYANIRNRGWDHVIWITISTAASAAKLLKINVEKIAEAISIAIASNIPLRQIRIGELSNWKGLAAPYAAKAGLLAAILAKEGITGPRDIFEGEHGFFARVSGKSSLDISKFCKKGNKFKIKEAHIKKYPAEYNSLSAIEAALTLRKRISKTDFKKIRKIKISTFSAAYQIISDKKKWLPTNRETADHSMPYIVCVALLDGTISERQFSRKRINSPDIKKLIQKVSVSESSQCNADYYPGTPNKVEIVLQNGKTFSEKVIHPRGSYKNPMTDQEVEEKFKKNVRKFLSSTKAEKVLKFLWNIEKQKDVRKLFSLL